ncbi:MAG: hypothetical protein QXT43_01640 [Candidatus Micrarchaeaceae archaeon]
MPNRLRKALIYAYAAFLLFVSTASAASPNVTSIVTQSYTPPRYLSAIIGIVLIIIVVYVGFKFLKSIVKSILLLLLLFILASVAYSFLTTGTLTLSGAAGLIASIAGFIKDIVGVSHTVANAINSTSKAVNSISNVSKV